MYTPQHQSHYAQQQPQSVAALYPQARKLQFELKMQLSYLDSGRTGGKSNDELQSEARENLSQLQQLLWQLDSLVQVYPNPGERETWVKYAPFLLWLCWKLQQLRNETQALGTTLEQHIYRVSRREVEARERENLLNRRNAGFDGSNNTMYAAQESASLQKSSQMVSDLTSLSQSILGELGDQRNRMKVRLSRAACIA
ncbi:hypothetical protein FI667_g6769, partial [Globisporangium splendens]